MLRNHFQPLRRSVGDAHARNLWWNGARRSRVGRGPRNLVRDIKVRVEASALDAITRAPLSARSAVECIARADGVFGLDEIIRLAHQVL